MVKEDIEGLKLILKGLLQYFDNYAIAEIIKETFTVIEAVDLSQRLLEIIHTALENEGNLIPLEVRDM